MDYDIYLAFLRYTQLMEVGFQFSGGLIGHRLTQIILDAEYAESLFAATI